jgi:protein O-mannosyl-transferase
LEKDKKYYYLILVLVLVLYGTTLQNDYAIDDEIVILNNNAVKQGFGGVSKIFTSPFEVNVVQSYGYRPFVLTTFAIEYAIFGENPTVSHLINLLLYALTCLLLFKLLAEKVFPNYNKLFLFIIVLLFTIHPIHSEVVNNIKSRDELLYFLLGLVSLYHLIKYVDTKKILYLLFAIFCLLLGALSKSSIIIFLAISPLVIYFSRSISIKQIMPLALIYSSGMILFWCMRLFLLDAQEVRQFEYYENPLFFEEFQARIPASLYILFYYFKLLIYPVTFRFYYGFDQISHRRMGQPFSIYLPCSFIFLSSFTLLKSLKNKSVISFGILAYLIAILPFSNLLIPAVGIVAERFAYLASFGFVIMIVSSLFMVFKINPLSEKIKLTLPVYTVLLVVVIFSVVRVNSRNLDWKDKLTLYRADIGNLEQSYKANSLLGSLLLEKADQSHTNSQSKIATEAIKHFEIAVQIYPYSFKSWNNLGLLYMQYTLEKNKALKALNKAIETAPEEASSAYINKAILFEKISNITEAQKILNQTITKFPYQKTGYIKLIELLFKNNEFEEADKVIEKAITNFPNHSDFYLNGATSKAYQKDMAGAVIYYESYLRFDPNNKDLIGHIAKLHKSLGNEEAFQKYNSMLSH